MGKNLKGRECGKGIYQREGRKYSARYYAKDGKRKEGSTLIHCRKLKTGWPMRNMRTGTI